MVSFKAFRKAILNTAFLFFLSSCSSPSSACWNYDEAITYYPCGNSAQITYSPEGIAKGLEIALCRNAEGIRLYLNLLVVPVCPDASGKFEFHYEIDGNNYTAAASVMRGGQRLLVDEESADMIINTFLNGQAVTFKFSMYNQTITSDKFLPCYQKLQSRF